MYMYICVYGTTSIIVYNILLRGGALLHRYFPGISPNLRSYTYPEGDDEIFPRYIYYVRLMWNVCVIILEILKCFEDAAYMLHNTHSHKVIISFPMDIKKSL